MMNVDSKSKIYQRGTSKKLLLLTHCGVAGLAGLIVLTLVFLTGKGVTLGAITVLLLLLVMAVGAGGAVVALRGLKRLLGNMLPEEAAEKIMEKTAILQAINEGILAINRQAVITEANRAAEKIFGRSDLIGRSIYEVLPDSRLPLVMQTGQPEIGQQRVVNRTIIISNRVPIKINGEIIGAVATFRDRTDFQRLAEELTGIKAYVEALRVQNHEFKNRLHTIAGLIQLGQPDKALSYIFDVIEGHQHLVQRIIQQIRFPYLAGLIIGKIGRAKELKIDFVVSKDTFLGSLPRGLDEGALVIIIGNLLENAFDAVKEVENSERRVELTIKPLGNWLRITVGDTGVGISPGNEEAIFAAGYSTKGKEHSGLGLHLVKSYVTAAGGNIVVRSAPGKGTTFELTLPLA